MMNAIEINLGALIRCREAGRKAHFPDANGGIITSESNLKEIVDGILKKLPPRKQSVTITNQGIGNGADGYFIMGLDQEKLSLNEHKTFQKMAYYYDFKTHQMMMNGKSVDRSFITQFLNKMDMGMKMLKDNKAKLLFKDATS